MQLRVLGPLELVGDDERPIALRGAQLRRALATLAVHAPGSTPVDVLNDVLWPGGPPSSNALQATMSKLRKTVAPIAIDATGAGYQLGVAGAELDAHHFELLTTAGREAAADGRHDAAVEQLSQALTLWRGRPFDDLADVSIGQASAARLLSLREAAITTRLECAINLGQIELAAAELESLVVAEPFVERWWALLMIARYRQDRQADALRAFQQARTILADELGLEPGPELRDLETKILQQHPSLGPSSRAVYSQPTARTLTRTPALPARLASFVGRATHIETLSTLVAKQRLVTIVGPGGAGKTSLAIEVGRGLAAATAQRVVLVELASVPRGGDVVAAAAAVVAPGNGDLRSTTGQLAELDRIVDVLGDQPTIVLLDNCEHVIADAATFAHALLQRTQSVSVLATSREPLALTGEWLWAIPPLTADESVELLRDRAEAIGVKLAEHPELRVAATRLVERLDGMPLAIELAAARLRSMTLVDMVERLDDRFALLSAGPRSAVPRQQTLRSLVDWSHDLLDDRERVLFRRLAVFSGGATLEAIERVCADAVDAGAGRLSRRDVDELIGRLVDKSLVLAERTGTAVRYRMLQTLADYAAERLHECGESEQLAGRHARYFAERVASVERGLMGAEQGRHLAWLRLEWSNISTAIDHALAVDDGHLAIALVAPLGWYFFMIDETVAGAEWLHAALACSGTADPRLETLALGTYSFLASMGPDPANAALVAERALARLDSYHDPNTDALVAGMYVICQLFLGRMETCRQVFPLVEEAAHRAADRWTTAVTALIGAEITLASGDLPQAEREMRRAADGFAAVGDRFAYSLCVAHASELAEMHGDYDRAVRMLEESLAVAEDVGFSVRGTATRSRLANLEILRGNLALATSIHMRALESACGCVPQWVHGMSALGLSNIARRRGEPQEALRWIDEGLALDRSHNTPIMLTSLLVARGYSADFAGDAPAALAAQREGLAVALSLGGLRVVANAVEGLAGALALDGQAATAAHLLGAADAMRRRSGGPMPAPERFDVDRAERRARDALGDAEFDAAFAAGAADPDATVSTVRHQVEHAVRV